MCATAQHQAVFLCVAAFSVCSAGLFPSTGCGEEAERTVITVPEGTGDPVRQLYEAVNDSEHAGALVEVRAGEYILDADKDAFGHDGYLVPPPGMEIRGENRYRDVDGDGVWDAVDWLGDGNTDFADPSTETVIDAANLELFHQFEDMPFEGARAVLSVGAGQIVRSLTIRNHPIRTYEGDDASSYSVNGLIGGVSELDDSSAGLRAEIYDCVLEDGFDGILLGNFLYEPDGRPAAEYTIEGNISRGHWHAGLMTMNAPGLPGGSLEVRLAHNRSMGNDHGLVTMGGAFPTHTGRTVTVRSVGNVYEGNARGMLLYGGWNGATGNTLNLESVGDVIAGNNLTGLPWFMGFPGGGVWAIGGVTDDTLGTYDNVMVLDFTDTIFVRGSADPSEENVDYQSEDVYIRRDLLIWGGTCDGPDTEGCALAADNTVDVTLQGNASIGDEETAYEVVTDVFPETVSCGTNEVFVHGTEPDPAD